MSGNKTLIVVAIALVVIGTALIGMWNLLAYPGDLAKLEADMIGSVIGFSVSIFATYKTIV